VSLRSPIRPQAVDSREHGEPQPTPAREARKGPFLHPSDLLIPIAVGLWALGVSRVSIARPGPYGLLPALPILFYAGLAVFLISVTCELMRARPSPWRMAVHAVALVFMLYGTAPLLYFEARYEWFYKTAGVVQFINVHGQLDRHIDIYQNWPGFFAFAAWFDKVAGISTPLSYGKWVQVAFELAAIPVLYLIYDALSLSVRQRWVAILLYSAANWIGQDYFSPQALSTVLSLGIMAIVMRWLYARPPARLAVRPSAGSRLAGMEKLTSLSAEARSRHPGYRPPEYRPPWHRRLWHPSSGARSPWYRRLWHRPSGSRSAESSAPAVAAILVIFCFLTATHQLTPYMLVVQLGALAAARLLHPRWLPIVLAAIAIGYLIPRYPFVATHYGLTKNFGNFFANLKPPSFSVPRVSPSQQFIQRCAEALSVGIWLLAGLGAWLNRHAGRAILGLILLAYSPVVLLAFGSYGSEGILRVYLFSLPWSAALAAMVLAPPSDLASSPGARHSGLAAVAAIRRVARTAAEALRVPASFMKPGVLRIPAALGIAVALFFPAFFGDDGFNHMTRSEVDILTSFWLHAKPGHVFLAINQAPVGDTWRYNLFPLSPIFGGTLFQSQAITYSVADQVAQRAQTENHRHTPTYIIITDNMIAYNNSYGIVNPASFAILRNSLQRSHSWKLVLNRAGVVVYELPPLQSSTVLPATTVP
jgi:hypothetical protein